MTEPEKTKYIKKIKATYKESTKISADDIGVQLEFAEVLVEQDIENGSLNNKFKEMGIVYLTSHYLYLNYSKTKKDALDKFTSKERAFGVLGKGYEASPYGQQYMLISNKKSDESKNSTGSSGVMFL